jgi:hypothetical protein
MVEGIVRRAHRRVRTLLVTVGSVAAVTALVATIAPVTSAGAGTVTAQATIGSDGVMVDGFGGIHAFTYQNGTKVINSVQPSHTWPGWDIVRGIALRAPNSNTCAPFGGYVLDGFGGLHPFGINGAGAPARPTNAAYWPGWDIARDVALVPTNPRNPDSAPAGGFVLDGYGGLHYFQISAGKPAITGAPYWPNFDIARGIIILTDSSGYHGGFIVDAWGGLHSFKINGTSPPAVVPPYAYFPGRAIEQGGSAVPGSSAQLGGAFTLDGFGGLHAFKIGSGPAPAYAATKGAPYWPGRDIARGVSIRARKQGC